MRRLAIPTLTLLLCTAAPAAWAQALLTTEAPLPAGADCAPATFGPQDLLAAEPVAGTPADADLDALLAAGLLPVEPSLASDIIECPEVRSCPSGGNVVCGNGSCSVTDTGAEGCSTGQAVGLCLKGQTIHVQTCTCTLIFQARCCTVCPCCLCLKCFGSSQTFFCQ